MNGIADEKGSWVSWGWPPVERIGEQEERVLKTRKTLEKNDDEEEDRIFCEASHQEFSMTEFENGMAKSDT